MNRVGGAPPFIGSGRRRGVLSSESDKLKHEAQKCTFLDLGMECGRSTFGMLGCASQTKVFFALYFKNMSSTLRKHRRRQDANGAVRETKSYADV
jgi:hypothetical protein